jgi:hypothetical protein
MNFHEYTEREGAADRYEQLQSRVERFLPPIAKQPEQKIEPVQCEAALEVDADYERSRGG